MARLRRAASASCLRLRGPTARTIVTNSGTGGALEAFSAANLDAAAYGYDLTNPGDPNGALFTFFGVNNQVQLDALIDWGWGYQVDTTMAPGWATARGYSPICCTASRWW